MTLRRRRTASWKLALLRHDQRQEEDRVDVLRLPAHDFGVAHGGVRERALPMQHDCLLHQKALGGLRHALTSCFGRERALAGTGPFMPVYIVFAGGQGAKLRPRPATLRLRPRALPRSGRFGRRRCVVKLAKQRENSVSLRDPCAWTARAGRRSDRRRPSCAVGCVGGCTNITQIVAETTHLPQALGLAALRHARDFGPTGLRVALAGSRAAAGSDCATGGASAPAGIGGSAAAVPSGLCVPAPPRRGAIHFSQPRSLAGHTCALHGFAGGSANRIADGED